MSIKKVIAVVLGLLSALYLVNPTAGIFELLPDAIPFVGNVDETLAAYVLYSSIEYLRGKPIGLFRRWTVNSPSTRG